MSIFNEINIAYDKWRTGFFDNQRRAIGFSHQFAEEYRKYISAPEKCSPIHDHDMVPKYVWPCEATLIEEEDRFEAKAKSESFIVVKRNKSGEWYFALAIRCEHGPNTWPKEWFPILIFFSIHDDDCHLRITIRDDGHFDIKLSDIGSWKPTFDFITKILKQTFLEQKVSQKEQMGFVFPAMPAPDPPPTEPSNTVSGNFRQVTDEEMSS